MEDRRPAQHLDQDPGHRAGPAGDHRDDRRRHQRQRHVDLLAGALPGRDRRVPVRTGAGGRQRPRPEPDPLAWPRSSSPGWTPRWTSGWTRSAPTRPTALKGKAAIANARLAYEVYEQAFATDRWARAGGQGRQPAAAAVGLDRGQGPRPARHPLRHRAGGGQHRQHHAGEDDAGLRRPRRGDRRHRSAAGPARRSRSSTPSRRSGISYDDVVAVLETEGVDKFDKSWDELVETVRAALEGRDKEEARQDA